uniref:Mu-theraphotoxin-Osp1a n=1 Tax=Orphnaecus sp. (strain Sibaliw/Philippines) TaxID=2024663 RepID=NTA_ORPS2|nr:RecName: Full=Mu-theraphotoxin-Osp1a; Short=Mu-TRTX-Osp1a [Orphnaecus sp. Sibaliw]
GCKGFGKACKYGADECCKNLVCSKKHKWCKYTL